MTAAVVVRNTPTDQRVSRDEATSTEISTLIERSYNAFNELYEPGDFEQFPWLEANLAKVEMMADRYSAEKLHAWLTSLYKRYRSAKRGAAAQSTHH